jgi:hypothetical protein
MPEPRFKSREEYQRWKGQQTNPTPSQFATASDSPTPGGMKEYKVITQKDRFFAGKFDPEQLERALNSYAEQGWVVVSVATASIPSFTGTREELIVVMERTK